MTISANSRSRSALATASPTRARSSAARSPTTSAADNRTTYQSRA